VYWAEWLRTIASTNQSAQGHKHAMGSELEALALDVPSCTARTLRRHALSFSSETWAKRRAGPLGSMMFLTVHSRIPATNHKTVVSTPLWHPAAPVAETGVSLQEAHLRQGCDTDTPSSPATPSRIVAVLAADWLDASGGLVRWCVVGSPGDRHPGSSPTGRLQMVDLVRLGLELCPTAEKSQT
jgi:hypothetical protein